MPGVWDPPYLNIRRSFTTRVREQRVFSPRERSAFRAGSNDLLAPGVGVGTSGTHQRWPSTGPGWRREAGSSCRPGGCAV